MGHNSGTVVIVLEKLKFNIIDCSDGVWDIEAWHKSSSSRCASPAVDGKCVTFDTGKKIELLDNIIELAPQRRSFFQGCYVPSASESEKEKDGPSKRLGARVGLGNDSKTSFNEGKDRLTARASLRRRTIEKAASKDNVSLFSMLLFPSNIAF